MLLTSATTAAGGPQDLPPAVRIAASLLLFAVAAAYAWVGAVAVQGKPAALSRIASHRSTVLAIGADPVVFARMVVPFSALVVWMSAGVALGLVVGPSEIPLSMALGWWAGVVVLGLMLLVVRATGRPAALVPPLFRGRSPEWTRQWLWAARRADAWVASLRQQVSRAIARGLPARDERSVEDLLEGGEWELALETLCVQMFEYDVVPAPADRAVLESLGAELRVPVAEMLAPVDEGSGA